jgi:hypothetical protein
VATVVATRLTPCTSCNASPHHTGLLRAAYCLTPSMLAARDHARGADMRSGHDGGTRRSGAAFCNGSTTRYADSGAVGGVGNNTSRTPPRLGRRMFGALEGP